MSDSESMEEQQAALLAQMQAIQQAIIAETGGLDLTEYRRRLAEAGVLAAWNALPVEYKQIRIIETRPRAGAYRMPKIVHRKAQER